MLKLLIVDDERVIRDGLKNALDWAAFGYELCGAAENGDEAYEIIRREKPELVICDIKMPGMSGIDLITRVCTEMSGIHFVILSGYSEFEFAKKALQYGVHDYLLKPCEEEEIIQVITKVREEIEAERAEAQKVSRISDSLRKVLPQAKEQFLRELVSGLKSTENALDYFLSLFGLADQPVRLLVLKMDQRCAVNEKFVLYNVVRETVTDGNVLLSSIQQDELLVVITAMELNELNELLIEMREKYHSYYVTPFSVGISNADSFRHLHKMYEDVENCLKCEFYLGEGSVISGKQFDFSSGIELEAFRDEITQITTAVRTGNLPDMKSRLGQFFRSIKDTRLEITIAKTYCTELFLNIIRQAPVGEVGRFSKKLIQIASLDTLDQIIDLILPIANHITEENYNSYANRYSSLIRSVIQCVDENLANPALSLSWIAREVLFMNENYLGKLFFKETGERFSQYVTNKRVEKAKELILSEKEYKIYEISTMTGFDDNTQYFSQVFKKATGMTPSEYRRS